MNNRAPKIGLFLFYTEESAPLVPLARLAEDRGIESLWVPEHTHIPVQTESGLPYGGSMPRQYPRLYDPFVVLSAIAAVTSRIRLGTGVALAAQHSPITLAKQCASLDQLSRGRLILGVGAGWNRREVENHGVDFDRRWSRTIEHIQAMRAIWEQDDASFSGEWASFDPIWSWPKPYRGRRIPILLGTARPSTLVARHADGWLPLSAAQQDELPDRIDLLRQRMREEGREPEDLDVTVMCLERTAPERVVALCAAGATRVVLRPSHIETERQVTEFIDDYAALLPGPVPGPTR